MYSLLIKSYQVNRRKFVAAEIDPFEGFRLDEDFPQGVLEADQSGQLVVVQSEG